jgi:hypothetical protein
MNYGKAHDSKICCEFVNCKWYHLNCSISCTLEEHNCLALTKTVFVRYVSMEGRQQSVKRVVC